MSFESQQRIDPALWETLKCPFCGALFRAEKKDLNVKGHYSFSCLSCSKIFWAEKDEHLKIEVFKSRPLKAGRREKNSDAEKVCRRCFATIKKGVVECYQCGGSFYDSQWKKQAPDCSYVLRQAFENLLDNYGPPEEHEKFSALCLREGNAAFAFHCYSCLSRARSHDKKALEMTKYFAVLIRSRFLKQTTVPFKFKVGSGSYLSGWLHSSLLFLVLSALALWGIASLIL